MADLSGSQRSNLYFDVYYFLIKTQLKGEKNMDAMTEDDLPWELKKIELNIDLNAPDHIMMYLDLINRVPRSQETRQRLNIAEKIFLKANTKR